MSFTMIQTRTLHYIQDTPRSTTPPLTTANMPMTRATHTTQTSTQRQTTHPTSRHATSRFSQSTLVYGKPFLSQYTHYGNSRYTRL